MRIKKNVLPAVILVFVFTICSSETATSQSTNPPPANPDDVATVDSILDALYGGISGPAGEARDWDRFRSLFMTGARLIPVVIGQDGSIATQVWSPQDYVDRAGAYLENNGFFELEIARTTEAFGHIFHAFSTYESRQNADDEKPFARGINSIQLMNDGSRWWIVSIFWDSESETQPLPDHYQPEG